VTTRERIEEVLRQLGLGDSDLLESLRARPKTCAWPSC
jgi:hypothetical protein